MSMDKLSKAWEAHRKALEAYKKAYHNSDLFPGLLRWMGGRAGWAEQPEDPPYRPAEERQHDHHADRGPARDRSVPPREDRAMIDIPVKAATTMFASHTPGEKSPFRNFYPSKIAVKMCGSYDDREDPPIVKVRVSVDPAGAWWAWWDHEDQRLTFVYPARLLTAMCFPYGPEAEEERDRGRMCRVSVELIKP